MTLVTEDSRSGQLEYRVYEPDEVRVAFGDAEPVRLGFQRGPHDLGERVLVPNYAFAATGVVGVSRPAARARAPCLCDLRRIGRVVI